MKVKIDFNESKVNKENFKVYPEINPIYLVNIGNDEKIFYSKTFAWIENDILEIEFDCNSDDLSSNASIRIVLIEGENITILLKK